MTDEKKKESFQNEMRYSTQTFPLNYRSCRISKYVQGPNFAEGYNLLPKKFQVSPMYPCVQFPKKKNNCDCILFQMSYSPWETAYSQWFTYILLIEKIKGHSLTFWDSLSGLSSHWWRWKYRWWWLTSQFLVALSLVTSLKLYTHINFRRKWNFYHVLLAGRIYQFCFY